MKFLYLIAAGIPLYVLWDIYRYVFRRKPSKLTTLLLDKKGHCDDYYKRRDSAAEALRNLPQERWEIHSDRGERLQGYYIPAGEKKSRRVVFIVHGYRSEHAETAGVFRELYHSRGFDIFTCDHTAAGKSGGRTIGYGVFESADCLKWLDYLQEKLSSDIQIILHGFSMGGATVLKMSDRLPDCVKFIVEDSGFIDAREILRGQLGPLYKIMYGLNRLIGGFDLADSDVRDNLRRSDKPLLVVHGEKDATVPFSMAPRIFELCPNEKDCLFTPDIKHIETVHYNRNAYEEKLDGFIEKYIK